MQFAVILAAIASVAIAAPATVGTNAMGCTLSGDMACSGVR